MPIKHLLGYGTNADQKYFHANGFDDMYDAIVINANTVAFSPAALASFIVKKTVNKFFFIDPITHAFQHNQSYISDDSGEKIKKSISKLIKFYGPELEEIISQQGEKGDYDLLTKRKLLPDDVNDAFIEPFTRKVLDFQKNVAQVKNISEYKDYIDFANAEDPSLKVEVKIKPDFLVAPYFYLDDIRWLEKNIALIEKAKALEPDEQVYAEIVLSKKFINKVVLGEDGSSAELESIIQKYQQCSADGFLIWVDGFSEHEEFAANLSVYIDLLRRIRNGSTKKLYTLYGSYFSILLTHPDLNVLDGVCHGLEYGESREVVPVGGGIPTAKYYFYPLHKRVKEAEMFNFLSKTEGISFCKDICGCNVCKELMDSTEFLKRFNENFGNTNTVIIKGKHGFITKYYPSSKTKDNSLRHYLHMKYKEFNAVSTKPLTDLMGELTADSTKYANSFNPSDYEHLSEWHKAISQIQPIAATTE